MTDHGEPCTEADAAFCMNGGKCFTIPFMSTLNCVCSDNYIGSRCERFQLPSTANNSGEKVMIAAVIAILILIILVMAGIIYYICKLRSKASKNRQAKQKYWKVKPSRAAESITKTSKPLQV